LHLNKEDIVNLPKGIVKVAMGTVLGGIVLLAAGSPALADRDYKPGCRDRLNADKARLDRDARRFGESSRQVDRDRDRMESDRSWCRSHHADWDHNIFDLDIYVKKH
jgi:hypothetical protein